MPIRGKPGANPVQPPLPYFGQPISRNTRRLQSVLILLLGKEKYRRYKKAFLQACKRAVFALRISRSFEKRWAAFLFDFSKALIRGNFYGRPFA